jgi:hypothetical protein
MIGRRTVVPRAEIVDVFAIGLLVRPSDFDCGLTFGYRHATYIYPLRDVFQEKDSKWFYFHGPALERSPLLRATTSFGFEAQLTPEVKRCTVGYLDQLLIDGGNAEKSKTVKLHYERNRPARTRLKWTSD